jgi:hypothetical protein
VCWVNEPEHDVPESGFYALDRKGRELVQPLVRLVAVQHRMTGAHHYRKAGPGEHSPPVGNVVDFDLDVEGKTDMTAA